MKTSSKIIACDFDQVIHDKLHPVAGRRMGPPFPLSKLTLENWKRLGYTVIVHTTMANTEGGKKAVADWMAYYNIPFDSIEPKIAADYYVDDKAIKHLNWETTIDEVN